ncbi:hypothetical protein AOLI_G00060860 [Acnodon oligacanthus]
MEDEVKTLISLSAQHSLIRATEAVMGVSEGLLLDPSVSAVTTVISPNSPISISSPPVPACCNVYAGVTVPVCGKERRLARCMETLCFGCWQDPKRKIGTKSRSILPSRFYDLGYKWLDKLPTSDSSLTVAETGKGGEKQLRSRVPADSRLTRF